MSHPQENSGHSQPAVRSLPIFASLVGAATALFALCWPTERSFDLWVFKDRGSFLYLDYMLDQHLRLGVDTFYAYGLLPVLLQRVLFAAFGRGPWPLIGCHFVYILLTAAAWTMIVRRLSRPWAWTAAVIAVIAIVLWVNPNFPYVLVQLSLLFSIAFLLQRRYSLAIAVSAIGCWSVPTVTLLASALLVGIALIAWVTGPDRSMRSLLRLLLPGALAYIGLGLILAAVFGTQSVIATALPFQGMAFYKATHFGMFTTLKEFLRPDHFLNGSALRYYLFDRATWWMLSSVLLIGMAVYAIGLMLKKRRFDAGLVAVVFCAAIHAAFSLRAYGTPSQHVIYDPIIVAGVIIGLDLLPLARWRPVLIGIFMTIGVLGEFNQVAYTRYVWKATRPSPQSANLYASADFVGEWSRVIDLSKSQRTLVLSYSSGLKHYFPSIDNADVWTLQTGEVFESDRQRLLTKMRAADVIAEDLTGPTGIFETDPDIVSELGKLCLIAKGKSFIIWKRPVGNEGCASPAGSSASGTKISG